MDRDDWNRKGLIEQIKSRDMVDYLAALGYHPERIRNADYWYLSPLRSEHTASFKINRKLNRWYDHGLGKGGSIIDFGMLLFNCSVGDFLHRVENNIPVITVPRFIPRDGSPGQSKLLIKKVGALQSFALARYLLKRKIPVELARQYCHEICYEVNGKNFFAIGFKNDSGGYELRSPYFKGSSSPKDITTIKNGSETAGVFEGFIDFLSFIVHNNGKALGQDFVILNSGALFERARPFMEQYERINLYLDRDTTGQNCSAYALSISDRYKDESSLYDGYKDLNEWLVKTSENKKLHKGYRL